MKKSLIFAGMLAIGYANAQEGRVGINTDNPNATLDVKAKTNDGSKVLELQNSDGTKLVSTLDNGNIGIGTDTPERKISILGDQPDALGQFIIRTTDSSTSNAGITLLSKNAHASLKMGAGEESDAQIVFDTWEKLENNNYSHSYNMYYLNNIEDKNKRYLGFKSNIHPGEQYGIYFNVLGRLGLGIKEPTEKIEAYNPKGFTVIKATNDLGASKFGTRNSGNTYIGFQNKFQLWNIDDTSIMFDVTQEGNMGIGVIDPSEKLEVDGKIKASSLAQSGAGDRVVYADENGVLKTGVSAAANVKLATANNVECTEANTGTMNFGSVTINGKATEAFGFCMKNSTGEYKWYYIYGGAGITTGSGAFGSNL